MRIRPCHLLIFWLLLGVSSRAVAASEGTHLTLPAKTRAIPATLFRAPGQEKRPSVLVLHGAGGLGRFRGAFELYSAGIAHSGFDTYLVEYFVDGNEYGGGATIEERFEAWTRGVDDVADYLLKQPESNGRVGLVGFSNGGILAAGPAPWTPRSPPLSFITARRRGP